MDLGMEIDIQEEGLRRKRVPIDDLRYFNFSKQARTDHVSIKLDCDMFKNN